eukprot:XP_011665471.1 PREDICTED: uncharacterized protein LOC105438847 [Strongylocentrotus purpuratus]
MPVTTGLPHNSYHRVTTSQLPQGYHRVTKRPLPQDYHTPCRYHRITTCQCPQDSRIAGNEGLNQEVYVRTLNSVQPADLRAAETVQSFPEVRQEMVRGTLNHHQTTYRSAAESVQLVPEDMIKQVAERGTLDHHQTTYRDVAESVQSVPEDIIKREVQGRTLSSVHSTDMCVESASEHTNKQEMESRTSNSLRHTEQSVDITAPSVPEHITQKAESWTLHMRPEETNQLTVGALIKREVESNAVHYLSPMKQFVPSVIEVLIKAEAEAFSTTCGRGDENALLTPKTNIKQEPKGESLEEGVSSSLEGKINQEVDSTTHNPVSSSDGNEEPEQSTSQAGYVDRLLASRDNVSQPACFSKRRINGKLGIERRGYLMMIRASVAEKGLLSTKHPAFNGAVRGLIRDFNLDTRSFPEVYKDFATIIHNKRNYLKRKQKNEGN